MLDLDPRDYDSRDEDGGDKQLRAVADEKLRGVDIGSSLRTSCGLWFLSSFLPTIRSTSMSSRSFGGTRTSDSTARGSVFAELQAGLERESMR